MLCSGLPPLDQRWIDPSADVVTLLTRWATYATPSRELLLTNVIVGMVFLVFAALAIVGRVFAAGPVTRHRVEGAVAVYLLLGLIFGSAFAFIAMTVPDAFAIDTTRIAITGWSRETYDLPPCPVTMIEFFCKEKRGEEAWKPTT